jgi:hypothetical protein
MRSVTFDVIPTTLKGESIQRTYRNNDTLKKKLVAKALRIRYPTTEDKKNRNPSSTENQVTHPESTIARSPKHYPPMGRTRTSRMNRPCQCMSMVKGMGREGKGRKHNKTPDCPKIINSFFVISCPRKGFGRESSSLDSGSAQLGVALIEEALGSPHWCCWRRPDDALEVNTTSL